jgi:hypothetical protein
MSTISKTPSTLNSNFQETTTLQLEGDLTLVRCGPSPTASEFANRFIAVRFNAR